MPAISHNLNMTDAHSGYAPGMVVATAANFTVGGQMVARVGDMITPHLRPNSPPHVGTVSAGAAKFSVGGMPVARIDDPTSCGGKMAVGFATFTVG